MAFSTACDSSGVSGAAAGTWTSPRCRAGSYTDAPGGYLYVRGVDGYERDDLGEGLQIVYYAADEVTRAGATGPDLTVTL
jgi:hypothetical protein